MLTVFLTVFLTCLAPIMFAWTVWTYLQRIGRHASRLEDVEHRLRLLERAELPSEPHLDDARRRLATPEVLGDDEPVTELTFDYRGLGSRIAPKPTSLRITRKD